MAIDRREIERIAELARIELSDAELETLARECREILDYFATLREIDDAELPPVAEDADGARLRADTVAPEQLVRSPEALAPAWRDGLFVLPRLPALDAGDTTDNEAR